MMRHALLVIVATLGLASPASAGSYDATFATFVGVKPSQVVESTAYELGAGDYTHLLFGRAHVGKVDDARAYLMRCDQTSCTGTPLWLGRGRVEVLGVVDLQGEAVAFPTRAMQSQPLGARSMKQPVLIVRTSYEEPQTTSDRSRREVTGTLREGHLALVSLARADRQATTLFAEPDESRSPTGAGFVKSFSFEREARGPLVLVVSEKHLVDNTVRCLPPPPTVTRYRIGDDGRYAKASSLPPRAGC